MSMFKQKKFSDVLTKKDADKLLNQFNTELQELRQKYGVTAHISIVEYFAKGENGLIPWTHIGTVGNSPQIVLMISHAYGSIRSSFDDAIDKVKAHAYAKERP